MDFILCTDSDVDKALAVAKSQLQGQKMKFLMGWNEAYDHNNEKAPKKWIPPTQAATWWTSYVQGMAARANLSLVSPTTGVEGKKLTWFGDMLLACWNQRNQGCDVETIVAFSVHDYKCGEDYWKSNYGTFENETMNVPQIENKNWMSDKKMISAAKLKIFPFIHKEKLLKKVNTRPTKMFRNALGKEENFLLLAQFHKNLVISNCCFFNF